MLQNLALYMLPILQDIHISDMAIVAEYFFTYVANFSEYLSTHVTIIAE